MAASPAYADTSKATANAAILNLLNSKLLSSGTFSASNDGSGQTTSGNAKPALSLLGMQTTISVGVLVQKAEAFKDGSSVACSGLVGNGAIVQIGPDGNCSTSDLPSGGVTINLPGIAVIKADAIMEQASAKSDGTVTAKGTVLNGTIVLFNGKTMTIGMSPAAGDGINLADLGKVVLNKQTKMPDGSIKASAFVISLIGDPVADAAIGTVTAGPNAAAAPVPIVPLAGIPIAALIVGFIAYRAWWVPKRRRQVVPTA
jgi:hypothetical protein